MQRMAAARAGVNRQILRPDRSGPDCGTTSPPDGFPTDRRLDIMRPAWSLREPSGLAPVRALQAKL